MAQNRNAVAVPAMPASANAAPIACAVSSPWSVDGNHAIVSDLVVTVGYQANDGTPFRRSQSFKLSSDGVSAVTCTDLETGQVVVIANPIVNAVNKHANLLDYLNTWVVKINAAGVLVPIKASAL